ncbi:MAG TPA: protein-L-isoaspartate(D-aspartate) O-methyltransferase [Paracoccaceae bacterium]|nr:protein-L-isoaspartate(D-aspartate) O-methyltransferase [Paracoccaceae bacterium]
MTAARSEELMQLMLALRRHGVTDARVLSAFEQTPREHFVDQTFDTQAYADSALPISCGQTISQPSVVAIMTQALDVSPRCKVLEVGAGSGYQAAILARLARRVYAIERHRELARRARERLADLDLSNVMLRTGDGTRGWPEQAPFDRIILSAAAEDAPSTLLEQLRTGGIMVLPVGQSDEVQQLIRIEKTAGGPVYRELTAVRFVPLVAGMPEDPDDEHGR